MTESAVVVAGDWHGSQSAARSVLQRARARGVSVVLHVGDLNVRAGGGRTSIVRMIDSVAGKAGLRVLVSPGNHDDWDVVDAAPLDDDGLHVLGRRVRAVPRGARFTIGGRRFGALGGAVSVIGPRRRGARWWPQEVVTAEHVRRLGTEPLDVLLTHDAPAGVPLHSGYIPAIDAIADAAALRARLHAAVRRTCPRLLFCGHWHTYLTHDLPHDRGVCTVHVLDREHRPGNAVVLDLTTMNVEVLP